MCVAYDMVIECVFLQTRDFDIINETINSDW